MLSPYLRFSFALQPSTFAYVWKNLNELYQGSRARLTMSFTPSSVNFNSSPRTRPEVIKVSLKASAPNLRIVSADDSSGSATNRVFLGIATGSNNFMNGSSANDTCLVCSEGGGFLLSNGTSYRFQIASSGVMYSPQTYQNTTSNSANMAVPNSDGQFYRSTSSIKYKDNVATLTDSLADKILNCRPVSYTSKCSNDDKTKTFYGLIAEEVDKIDQGLVFYNNETETPEPEGVQYDRFVPHLINLVKRQKAQIEALETRVTALEAG